MKIGIFGGTFDPIHEGHLRIAENAKVQFGLDKVVFVPAFVPPHKLNRRDMAPAHDRLKMTELAIKGYAGFEVSDIELQRPDLSFTVDTLTEMKKIYPYDDFYFIVGSDSLSEMDKWREPGKIREMAKIIAAPRKSSKFEEDASVFKIKMPFYDYSSSKIRELAAAGSAISEMVPDPVCRFIAEKKLYLKNRR